jgi:anthranilate synthase / indole-3-glycerol phosphate synthase / phosphoribosylanthranilate isomerase
MHGKLSRMYHDDARSCFKGIPQGFMSSRYHPLGADVSTIPDDVVITAATEDSGVMMGVRHRKDMVEAVQYRPVIASSTTSLSKVASRKKSLGLVS